MNIKYCLPIIKNSKKEVLKALKIKGYDFFEIWLDYIKDLDNQFIADLAKKYKKRLIFLFRRQNLEKIRLTIEKRQEIILLLSKSDVYLDLDFLTQYEELKLLKPTDKLSLILSYHNYKETPPLNFLNDLSSKMKRYSPDILKFSTFCKKETDSIVLLDLLLKLREREVKYIVLGMGEKGLITRIFGTLWGNSITFAPTEKTAPSAPGQLTLKKLRDIFSKIQ